MADFSAFKPYSIERLKNMLNKLMPMHRKEGSLTEKEKYNLLETSEISLILDGYNDIFSDFDPRQFGNRALSQDFLEEAKRASRDKDHNGLELNLLVPVHKRNFHHEEIIKKRLHEHFKKHFELALNDIRSLIKKGILFVIAGIIVMFGAALVLYYNYESLLTSFLVILLEPAGWFLFWEGLWLVIFDSKKEKPGVDFYHKMSKCKINFRSY